jgi:hypothetical protein
VHQSSRKRALYEPTDVEGVFRAKGMVRAIPNPTGQSVEITAPWGEPQYGDAECLFASVYDPAQPDVVGPDRYIIDNDSFLATYGTLQEVYGQQAAVAGAR